MYPEMSYIQHIVSSQISLGFYLKKLYIIFLIYRVDLYYHLIDQPAKSQGYLCVHVCLFCFLYYFSSLTLLVLLINQGLGDIKEYYYILATITLSQAWAEQFHLIFIMWHARYYNFHFINE